MYLYPFILDPNRRNYLDGPIFLHLKGHLKSDKVSRNGAKFDPRPGHCYASKPQYYVMSIRPSD